MTQAIKFFLKKSVVKCCPLPPIIRTYLYLYETYTYRKCLSSTETRDRYAIVRSVKGGRQIWSK